MNSVTEGGVVPADCDWDTVSRRYLVKLNANAFNMDLAYEADDDLLTLAHTGPAQLTLPLHRLRSRSGDPPLLLPGAVLLAEAGEVLADGSGGNQG